jgi:hypothetical protein
MGDEMRDSILDIAEAEGWPVAPPAPPSMDGPMGRLEAAVQAPRLEMIIDSEPTTATNPLL